MAEDKKRLDKWPPVIPKVGQVVQVQIGEENCRSRDSGSHYGRPKNFQCLVCKSLDGREYWENCAADHSGSFWSWII